MPESTTSELRRRLRWLLPGALLALCVGAAAIVQPIPQDPAYHDFADSRSWLGIDNFADTVSGIGFAVTGFWGLMTVYGRSGRRRFASRLDALPYAVFFLAAILVSAGSAYYHLAPDNGRLFWDRLPIAIAFMALFAAVLADRVFGAASVRWLLPLLIALGTACLLHWHWTESQGAGDLRFYALVQVYPILVLPLIVWLFPQARHTSGGWLFWIVGCYVAAKVLEFSDTAIFAALGGTVSGHSLKHVMAALSAAAVVLMLQGGSDRPR